MNKRFLHALADIFAGSVVAPRGVSSDSRQGFLHSKKGIAAMALLFALFLALPSVAGNESDIWQVTTAWTTPITERVLYSYTNYDGLRDERDTYNITVQTGKSVTMTVTYLNDSSYPGNGWVKIYDPDGGIYTAGRTSTTYSKRITSSGRVTIAAGLGYSYPTICAASVGYRIHFEWSQSDDPSPTPQPSPKPDLHVYSLSVNPEVASPGETVDVAYTIRNRGNASAGSSTAGIYVDGERVASQSISSLSAGSSKSYTNTLESGFATQGEHTITVKADDKGSVSEDSEGNNTATFTVKVPFLAMPSTVPEADAQACTVLADVDSNVGYSAQSDANWLAATPGDAGLSLQFKRNTSRSPRTAHVRVWNDWGQEGSITVTQAGMTLADAVAASASDGSSSRHVQIEWTNSIRALSYTVQRAQSLSGPWEVITSDAASPYCDTTTTPEVRYLYRVLAVNEAGAAIGEPDEGYKPLLLEVDKESLQLDSASQKAHLAIDSNYDWEISAFDSDWISFSPTSGSGDASVVVVVKDNPMSHGRSAKVFIDCGGKVRTLTVHQAGIQHTYQYHLEGDCAIITGSRSGPAVAPQPRGTLTIPSRLDGYTVTGIDEGAFYGCDGLVEVIIPSSVNFIGQNAFSECHALESVTVPSSVKRIGMEAFFCCSSLKRLTLEEGIESIGGFAFAGCDNLPDAEIPASVTSIGECAFSAQSLRRVTIRGALADYSTDIYGTGYGWFDPSDFFTLVTDDWTGPADTWLGFPIRNVKDDDYADTELESILIVPASVEEQPSIASDGCLVCFCSAFMRSGTVKIVRPKWSIESGESYADISPYDVDDRQIVLTAKNATASRQGVTILAKYSENGVTQTAKLTVVIAPRAPQLAKPTSESEQSPPEIPDADDAQQPADGGSGDNGGGDGNVGGDSAGDNGGGEGAGGGSGEEPGTGGGATGGGSEDGESGGGTTAGGSGGESGGGSEGGESGGGAIGGGEGTGGGEVVGDWIAEHLDTSFAKAQTVLGALYGKGGVPVGTVQVKAGKISKKGTIKISASATLLVDGKAKKVTAKAVEVAAGTAAPHTAVITFKEPIGDMAFEMEADGTFKFKNGSYVMAEKKVGENWTRTGARVYVAATSAALPQGTIEGLLPDGEPVIPNGGKWSFAKAASVKYVKDRATGAFNLVIDDTKGTNRSAMKLTYTPKTGIFKGSFKIYAIQDGKLKKFTAKVIGVVVDGKGWGSATVPGGASYAVTVE